MTATEHTDTATRPQPVKLWFCPNDELDPGLADTLAGHWLDEPERETAERFVFERDRRQHLIAHVLVRRVLALETGIPEADAVIRRSPRGRPFLLEPAEGIPRGGGELDFNLSHTRGHNLVGVVRRHRVGVDVERLDRDNRALDAIVESFAAVEQDWVAQTTPGRFRARRVLRLWTLKEAYSKARGLGLELPFDSFSFQLAQDTGVLGFRAPADDAACGGRWRFVELEPAPGVLAAVAVLIDPGEPTLFEVHHGFPWGNRTPQLLALPEPAPARV